MCIISKSDTFFFVEIFYLCVYEDWIKILQIIWFLCQAFVELIKNKWLSNQIYWMKYFSTTQIDNIHSLLITCVHFNSEFLYNISYLSTINKKWTTV